MNKNPAVRMSGLHNFRAGERRVHQRICTIIRQRAPIRGHGDTHTQGGSVRRVKRKHPQAAGRTQKGAQTRAREDKAGAFKSTPTGTDVGASGSIRRSSGRARSKARRRAQMRERTSDERTGAPQQADTGASPRFPHRPPPSRTRQQPDAQARGDFRSGGRWRTFGKRRG